MYALSPRVEHFAPPLVYLGGRAYRLDHTVVELLESILDPTSTCQISDTDLHVIRALQERGILVDPDASTMRAPQTSRRHPLSIHVRTYSSLLLRVFQLATVTYPLRNTGQAIAAILTGCTLGAAILGTLSAHHGGVAGLITRSSLADIVITLVISAIAMVVHEAAHASAARRAGYPIPRAGVGIYITHIVCFVDLTSLAQAPRRHRRHVDLAGMAADSLLLVIVWVLGVLSILHTAVVQLFAVSFVASLLFSLNPWSKSDFYWYLRDSHDSPQFDPANWLLQPWQYLRRALLPGQRTADHALLRAHVLTGCIWIAASLTWTGATIASFVGQPSYSGEIVGHWFTSAATLMLSLVGLSAIALALVKGNRWRST